MRYPSLLRVMWGAITNVPYHTPDDGTIGNCIIKFDIPTDTKWATVLIGAISELGRPELWEENTGTLTPDEAALVILEIIESVSFQAC